MQSLQIKLEESERALIDSLVQKGEASDASSFVEALVRKELAARWKADLEASLEAALDRPKTPRAPDHVEWVRLRLHAQAESRLTPEQPPPTRAEYRALADQIRSRLADQSHSDSAELLAEDRAR